MSHSRCSGKFTGMRINNAHDAVLYKDFLTCLRLGQMGLCVSSTPDSLAFRCTKMRERSSRAMSAVKVVTLGHFVYRTKQERCGKRPNFSQAGNSLP